MLQIRGMQDSSSGFLLLLGAAIILMVQETKRLTALDLDSGHQAGVYRNAVRLHTLTQALRAGCANTPSHPSTLYAPAGAPLSRSRSMISSQ
jgi:hypothetical protein